MIILYHLQIDSSPGCYIFKFSNFQIASFSNFQITSFSN
jgi:hypothetical protein